MDNRFLARGKRKDNSKWIEGDLIRSKGLYYIHPLSNGVTVKNTLGRLIVMHEIDPSTLGWCTGLTDKNGKRVFDGDIIQAGGLKFIVKFGKCGGVNNVDYEVGYMGFYVIPIGLDEVANNITRTDILYWLNTYEITVIGNIHDDPNILNRADMPVPDDVSQPVLMPATPENFELMHG